MDFQPVLMAAGRGSRLTPLSDNISKCLLPIGNIPMLWFPLRSFDLAGFNDILIIVLQSWKNKVLHALEQMQRRVPWSTPGFRYSFHTITDDCNEDEGTATTLLKIPETRKTDLLVMSSDLITTTPLKELMHQHCLHQSTLTCLMKQQTKPDGPIPGLKTKSISKESDIIGLDTADSRLLFIFSEADHEDSIPVKQTVLERHPCVDVTSRLEDCHLYCISKTSVFNDDVKVRGCSSLRSELVPYLVSRQFESSRPQREDCVEELSMDLVTKLSSWTDHTGDMDGPYHDSNVKCYVRLADPNRLCLRANSLPDYYEANKQIGSYAEYFGLTNFYKLPSELKRSQAGQDSAIGTQLKLGEKSAIKKSIIGNDCEIGARVKINNTILMNNVKIKDGSVLQTCIICEGSTVEAKTELKECIVSAKVAQPGKYTNEVVADDDEFAD
ncbi:translation initiation factor eIF2B subunit gamma-like [Watersipora subatra]|uniref:translation initiation factor eIF2B subunit gamma-like n=1 Tax=Watersipora subatra TaxID=2589382 RepID=UPI00355B5E8C